MPKELEDAVLAFFHNVVQERDKLANDLSLSSPERERHGIARDLAQAVVDAIAPPEPAAQQGDGQTPPQGDSGATP